MSTQVKDNKQEKAPVKQDNVKKFSKEKIVDENGKAPVSELSSVPQSA